MSSSVVAPVYAQGVMLLGAPAGPGAPVVDVLGRDAAGTLEFLVRQRRRQDEAAAEELRAITHWADLHRVEGIGAVDRQLHRLTSSATVAGMEAELRLAGEGACGVSEFAVAEVAAALRMSEAAGRALVGQGLELRDRLPRLWGRVMDGEVPAWKGRQVAQLTIPLNAPAAAYVDAQVAPFAHKVSLGRILRAVDAAVLRHDPGLAAERAEAAAEKRGAWLQHHLDGTTEISAVTGTPDAVAFDHALDEVATALGTLGDDSSREVRRAKAVGVLADPQYALDLTSTAEASPGHRPRRTPAQPTIHVHLHTDAVTGVAAEDGTGHLARVERFGPRTLEAARQWLADLAPGAVMRIAPVVDLTAAISVDAYEIPDRLRKLVSERDHTCVFPWCGRTGRFDLDHIDPYVPRDDSGPPGQTSGRNLARLCRFHHRVKTHGGWRYQREPDRSLTWTSPLGHKYAVDSTGTARR